MEHGLDQHVNIGSTDAPMETPLKSIGRDKLLLKADEKFNDITMGGIIVPNISMRNNRLKEYEVVKIGEIAKAKLGIDAGCRVSADVLARYYDSFPYSVIRWDSIVCLRDEKHAPHPLPGFAMFEVIKPGEEKEGGVLLLTQLQPRMKCLEVNCKGWEEYKDLIEPGKFFLPEKCISDYIQEGRTVYSFVHLKDVHLQADFD